MNYLVDTNVFLEVLLNQDKKEKCKIFLSEHAGKIYLSDFSLHSVGVILFRYSKENIFDKFTDDVLNNSILVSLPVSSYGKVAEIKNRFSLDFDDSYQICVANNYELTIATMDKDFERVKGNTKIKFI